MSPSTVLSISKAFLLKINVISQVKIQARSSKLRLAIHHTHIIKGRISNFYSQERIRHGADDQWGKAQQRLPRQRHGDFCLAK
jgi:hypothetical protein